MHRSFRRLAVRPARSVALAVGLAVVVPAQAHAIGDLTAPQSNAAPPAYATGVAFAVPYAASDEGGAGLARVDLYAKAPGELVYAPVASDTTPDTPVFDYVASAGDGHYSFHTVAVDNDGNVEPPPLLADDGVTLLDTAPPESHASAPASSPAGEGIAVTYTAADTGSGLAAVELWAKAPGESGFTPHATDASPDSPSFQYTPMAGPGHYEFSTVAVDRAGSREPDPAAGAPDAVVEVLAPPLDPPADPAPEPDPAPAAPPPPPMTSSATGTTLVQLATPTTGTPASGSSTAAPSLPLIAAVVLPGRQKLGRVLREGLRLRLYAYRGVRIRVALALPRRTAKRFGLRRMRVGVRTVAVEEPGIYQVRLRVPGRIASRLRRARELTFRLRTVVTAEGIRSQTTNPVKLKRG